MIQSSVERRERDRPGGVQARSHRLDRASRSVEPDVAQEQGQWRSQTAQITEVGESTGGTSRAEPEDQVDQVQLPPVETRGRQQFDSGQPDQMVDMQIMSQPGGALRPNVTLYPPLTVRLRSRDAGDSEADIARDMSHLWAFVSLTDEEGVGTLVPPRQGLLTGRLTDSPHPLAHGDQVGVDSARPEVIEDATDSFTMFPDLVIREVGRYRLRVTLYSMQTDTEEATIGPHGASSLQEVMSDIIEIRDRPRVEASAGKFLRPFIFISSPYGS